MDESFCIDFSLHNFPLSHSTCHTHTPLRLAIIRTDFRTESSFSPLHNAISPWKLLTRLLLVLCYLLVSPHVRALRSTILFLDLDIMTVKDVAIMVSLDGWITLCGVVVAFSCHRWGYVFKVKLGDKLMEFFEITAKGDPNKENKTRMALPPKNPNIVLNILLPAFLLLANESP